MMLDNHVVQEIPTSEYPVGWRVVELRRPIPGLFSNDTVQYLGLDWAVYIIQEKFLVLRPRGRVTE